MTVNEYLLWGDVFPGLLQVWVVNAVRDRLGPEASHKSFRQDFVSGVVVGMRFPFARIGYKTLVRPAR